MREQRRSKEIFIDLNKIPDMKFSNFLDSHRKISSPVDDDDGDFPTPRSTDSSKSQPCSDGSPMSLSPWSQTSQFQFDFTGRRHILIGSLVREEGHVYSLATSGKLLYTGSDSKNIRVWKNLTEFTSFKSSSGLVKAIIISGQKIFTGHQDGKIRVWKITAENPSGIHKRAGTLPTLRDVLKNSINSQNYVVRRNRTGLWLKHSDAISSLTLNEDKTILYSSSWDTTLKVWRISDSKCLESLTVHDDAVNAVVAASGGLVLTGSADGTVKVWRNDGTKHTWVQTLLKQESSVNALAVNYCGSVVYIGSSDGNVYFWERSENEKVLFSYGGVLKGHKMAVLCLAVAGNNMVFSGSVDKTICVWRREREGLFHSCVSVLMGHNGPVKCLAVEDDRRVLENGDEGWVLYSGSLDRSVKVWGIWDGVGV